MLWSKPLGCLTVRDIAIDRCRGRFAIRVSQERDGLAGGDGRLVIPRSDIGPRTKLGLEMTSLSLCCVTGARVAVGVSARVGGILWTREVQAGGERDDRSAVLGTSDWSAPLHLWIDC